MGQKARERSLGFTVAAQAEAVGRVYQALLAPVPAMKAAEVA
jgi:hypothetical protein